MPKNGAPKLPDIATIIKAGFERLGLKFPGFSSLGETSPLKEAFKKAIRVKDEQNAVMRYRWYNLPNGIDGELVERMLYYKGQLAFAYVEELDKFMLLPYTLCGDKENGSGLDEYSRFNVVRLVPFSSTDTARQADGKPKKNTTLGSLLAKKQFSVVYTVKEGLLEASDILESAVLLKDYTPQLPEDIIPRQALQDPIIDMESCCFPYSNTAMINSTGVVGIRVGNEDEQANVFIMNKQVESAALNGQKAIPVVGPIEWQELTGGKVGPADEFMVTAQAIDNFRLSLYGLENGGLYQKKTYVNDSQTEMNSGNPSDIYHNGLMKRQKFCDVVNSIWGLGVWCEAAEYHTGVDLDGDGTTDNRMDQSGTQEGEQQAGGV